MLLVAAAILAVLSVPLAGGRLGRLADLRLRGTGLVLGGLALQVLFFTAFPDRLDALQVPVHLATYAMAAAFLWLNRRVPGLWLIAVGAALNAAAIAANGGVMPAAPDALAAAGMAPHLGEEFANSAAVADPRLAVLGDVFAVPEAWPLSNVLSVGDLLIFAGLLAGLHVLCRSRLVPRGGGDWRALARERHFTRLWAAQATSSVGDFAFALALGVTAVTGDGGVALLGALLVVQSAAAALTGFAGGALVDRLPRRRLMLLTDAARLAAVTSVVVAGEPAVAHLLAVAAVLGAGGALYGPAMQASLPNIVPAPLLVAANAAVNATFNVAVLLGPLLGGLLSAAVGPRAAFALDAATFALSAALLLTVRLPGGALPSAASPWADARAGLRHVRATPLARAITVVGGLAMLGAALRQPLEADFVLSDLGGTAASVGVAAALWGAGMVLGAAAMPALARAVTRERLMAPSVAVLGACLAAAALAPSFAVLAAAWAVAGLANAVLVVAYESLLQERTPDALRGRVLAANEAVLDTALVAALVTGAALAGVVGTRGVLGVAAVVLLVAAAVGVRLLRPAPPRLAPSLHEHVPAGRHVLVRVAGVWDGCEVDGPVALRVGEVRIAPLPDPGAPVAAQWRAGYAVPVELLAGRPALHLDVPGGRVPLPAAA